MRLIKMTGGLGNQMFIYAFYLKMKKLFPHTKIDLSDMMHYHVHHGYEMNRVFALPHVEFCMNRTGKKILEFLFFKTHTGAQAEGIEIVLEKLCLAIGLLQRILSVGTFFCRY